MLGNDLKTRIEAFAERQRRDNPLLALARSGRVDARVVAAYLDDVHYLIRHTPEHLELARDRASALGRSALARHFADKVREEDGHHRWAEDDAARLASRFGVEGTRQPSQPIRELVSYLARSIERDPAVYLAYILFAEYLTVLLGPEWLSALAQHCGLPLGTLDVVEQHVELDREHVTDGVAELDALVPEDGDPAPFERVLAQSMRYFEAFCQGLSLAAAPRPEVASA